MLPYVEPNEGLWLVYEDGVQVFSGEYHQVESWLDLAENSTRSVALNSDWSRSTQVRVQAPCNASS